MPNKFFLRSDRMAVKPKMNEPDRFPTMADRFRVNGEWNRWNKHIAFLPGLPVEPSFLATLKPGQWFEGVERYEAPCIVQDEKELVWKELNKTIWEQASGERRLTIVAPQEAENGQEGGTVKTLSKVLTELWEEARERHTPVGKYYDVWTNSETDCIQRAMDAILIPATPQPVTGEAVDYFSTWLKSEVSTLSGEVSRSKAMNGMFDKTHLQILHKRLTEVLDKYQAASRPSDAVEFAEWLGNNYNPYYDGEGSIYWSANLREKNYTTAELYQLFLQSKSPNPNK